MRRICRSCWLCCATTVTGRAVNRALNVPAEDRRKLRQELHFCRKFGISGYMARVGIREPEDRYLACLLAQRAGEPGRADRTDT